MCNRRDNRRVGFRPALAALTALLLAQGVAFADCVTRTIETVAGGAKVTLSWTFTGQIESDLILEERLVPGWTVNDASIPYGSLDASWLSGTVARFAVKPTLLAQQGSISFIIQAAEGTTGGAVSGDWKLYLAGSLQKGVTQGMTHLTLAGNSANGVGSNGQGAGAGTTVEQSVAIASFKVVDGGAVELAYRNAVQAGTLVVEGCTGLGQGWSELKRTAVLAGAGKVRLEAAEVGGCHFMRMKLLTKED